MKKRLYQVVLKERATVYGELQPIQKGWLLSNKDGVCMVLWRNYQITGVYEDELVITPAPWWHGLWYRLVVGITAGRNMEI